MNQQQANQRTGGMIDQVRALRRTLVAEHGGDVDRLCDYLQAVERQFRAGANAVNSETLRQVVASWGEDVNDMSDEVRALRATDAK